MVLPDEQGVVVYSAQSHVDLEPSEKRTTLGFKAKCGWGLVGPGLSARTGQDELMGGGW